jgi:plasmid stabilization system protein ParE
MKLYTVVVTPRAERQLDNLYSYIGGIVADCLSLKTFPERGTKRDDIRPGLRTIGYRRRVTIAFLVDLITSTIAVHGVFYGGQDFEQLLRDVEADD